MEFNFAYDVFVLMIFENNFGNNYISNLTFEMSRHHHDLNHIVNFLMHSSKKFAFLRKTFSAVFICFLRFSIDLQASQ